MRLRRSTVPRAINRSISVEWELGTRSLRGPSLSTSTANRTLAICSHGIPIRAPTRVCSRRTCARLFASRHQRENEFRRREHKKGRDRGRQGGRADARKKVEKVRTSTDVVPVRSTRSDARWSCLVYPNYLLSRQVRRVHGSRRARFTVTFYPFSSPPLSLLHGWWRTARRHAATETRLVDVVFIDVAEIYADFAGDFVTAWRMSRCVRVLLWQTTAP